MLKLAGQNTAQAPSIDMMRASSGKRMSKHTHRPILPNSVSKVQTSSPGVKVSLSLNFCPPLTSMSKRWLLRQRAASSPERLNTKLVL